MERRRVGVDDRLWSICRALVVMRWTGEPRAIRRELAMLEIIRRTVPGEFADEIARLKERLRAPLRMPARSRAARRVTESAVTS